MKNFIVIMTLLVLSILISGLLITKVWNWFLPTIFDINTITYAHGICLSFVLVCTKNIKKSEKKSTTDDIMITFAGITIAKVFLLFLGWILYLLLI